MGMTEGKDSYWRKARKRVERANDRSDRWMRRHVRRGWGYRIGNVVRLVAIALTVFLIGLLALSGLILVRFSLDANTFFSIIFADIPVGVALWVAFERTQSKRRKLLDAVDIVEAPTRFTNLEIHYCDEFEDGIPPDVRYYVVNKKSKVAYFVDDEIQDLVEARFIRKFPRHRDLAELNRHFDNNHITHASGYPQGDDLFRSQPFAEEG